MDALAFEQQQGAKTSDDRRTKSTEDSNGPHARSRPSGLSDNGGGGGESGETKREDSAGVRTPLTLKLRVLPPPDAQHSAQPHSQQPQPSPRPRVPKLRWQVIDSDELTWDTPRVVLGRGGFGVVYRSKVGGWKGLTVAVKEVEASGVSVGGMDGGMGGGMGGGLGGGMGGGMGGGGGVVIGGNNGDTVDGDPTDGGSISQQMLRHECELLSRLSHPNLVKFYGGNVTRKGLSFIVIEFVAGGTLHTALHARRRKKNSLDHLIARLRVAEDIASAMDYLHRRSPPIVHRDLKPLNVLLSASGESGVPGECLEAKVCDFGLARIKQNSAVVTQVGGSFAYLAPEAYRQDPLTEKADVYS